jgi:hypothetical protein
MMCSELCRKIQKLVINRLAITILGNPRRAVNPAVEASNDFDHGSRTGPLARGGFFFWSCRHLDASFKATFAFFDA